MIDLATRCRRRQNGITLFMAMIGLIAMALAGVALIRAVETSNLIAGNFAFRSAAKHASDVGVEAAYTALTSLTSGSLETTDPSGCTTGCIYYPTQQTVNAAGIPSNVVWALVPGITVNNDYTVRYVIDRLCTGTVPITNLLQQCYAGASKGEGSKDGDADVFTAANELYFRATVRVEGPRNTVSYVQTVFSR